MTADSAILGAQVWKKRPFENFLKWWKPDYKIIPLNFAAGFLAGLSEARLIAAGHRELSITMNVFPIINYGLSRFLFRNDFDHASDPQASHSHCVVAGFMGALAGNTIGLLALKPDDYMWALAVRGGFKIYAALNYGNKAGREAPPPTLSV